MEAALNLLDVWLDARQAYDRLPGLSVGVVLSGELVWSRGFGRRDLDDGGGAMDADTVFSICSISRMFITFWLLS